MEIPKDQCLESVQSSEVYLEPSWTFKLLAVNYFTGFVSSRVSLTWWGESASLALVGHPSSDGITLKIPYGVDVLLHQPALHPIFSYWVG